MANVCWIKYLRNSLADASSGKGALKKADLKAFHRNETLYFSQGRLEFDSPILQKLFNEEKDEVLAVKAHYRPAMYNIKKEHGEDYKGTMPQVLSPILCPIWINRDGLFFSAGTPYIPRDLLAPQADDKFSIANVEDLDGYFTVHSVPSFSDDEIFSAMQSNDIIAEQAKLWESYYKFTRDIFKRFCSADKIKELYLSLDIGYIARVDETIGASSHILELYDKLSESNSTFPLLHTYTETSVEQYSPCQPSYQTVNVRLGHSSSLFPLAEAQRDALSHALNMKDSEILAINGPPGTGKTTFILSVVASLWVESAVRDGEPALIIAASTNNQAVTNVIDAFGKDFDEGNDELSGRWLPDVSSYGGYFPASSKEDEVAKKYQTTRFYSKLESLEYLDRAESYFFQRAKGAFLGMRFDSVSDIKKHLLLQLTQHKKTLAHIQTCWSNYSKQKVCVENLLGSEPESALSKLKQEIDNEERIKSEVDYSLKKWRAFLAEESIWLHLFSWLPFVFIKREAARKNFISNTLCHFAKNLQVGMRELEGELEDTISLQQCKIADKNVTYLEWLYCYQALIEAEARWVSSTKEVAPDATSIPIIDDVDSQLDISLRFRMFRLAVHYWEARWLEACREEGDNLDRLTAKTGLKSVLPRWRRRMMLTPCIVSTFHSLPSHMTYQAHIGDNEYETKYLFNEIDLLIVDEAGQVSPEVAGASFALAKRALVIGDIYQIEPIRQLTASIDIGNLKQSGVIQENDDYEQVQASGRSVVTGSVMHIAQQASKYHYKPEIEPGMFLQEHRRCYDELISYCNELCYNGLLLPKRGPANLKSPFPPFGYLHIDGLAELFGGSRRNKLEADTVASWLTSNCGQIEEYFGEPLEKAVGIITPFSAQVMEIAKACKNCGIKVGKAENQLTVGTVHSLQGAERKLVIFSQVYTKHSNGSFIDMNSTMLNVTVSRAKDSFLVFGDMDVIAAAQKSKPRGLLAKYLFEKEPNELKFSITGKRFDLLSICDKPKLLYNAEEHDSFIIQLLEKVNNNVTIVSPWLLYEKLYSTGILSRLVASVARGVSVTIYTDRHFNTTVANLPNLQKQKVFEDCCVALKEKGIEVNVIDGIHSKIIFADNKYMSVGSFNWLSAAREGKYANVETSVVYVGDLTKETKIHLDFMNQRIYRRYLKSVDKVIV